MNDNIRHMVSSIDLISGSFLDKHTGVYKLVHLSPARLYFKLFAVSQVSLPNTSQRKRSQSDGGTVCSSTGAKGAPLCSQPLWPPIIC